MARTKTPAKSAAQAVAEANGDPDGTHVVEPTLAQRLLESARPEGPWSGAEPLNLDPQLVDPDPQNPRSKVGNVDELAASLITTGMLQPVVVAPHPDTAGRYMVLVGHRRRAAALVANLPTIPALLRRDLIPGTNLSVAAQIVENLHRVDLTPLEEADAFEFLRHLGMTQQLIADAVHVNQSHVSKRLSLLKLDDDLRDKVGTGTLDVNAAVELAKLPDQARQTAAKAILKDHRPAGDAIARAKADHDRRTRYDTVVEQLEADGVAHLKAPAHGDYTGTDERPLALNHQPDAHFYGAGDRTVDLTIEAHADEPCHVAMVDNDGRIVWACVDAARHGVPTAADVAAKRDKADQRAAAKRLKEEEARKAASAARRDAARQAATATLDARVLGRAVGDWIAATLIGDPDDYSPVAVDPATRHLVLEWAGLDPSPAYDDDPRPWGIDDYDQLIAAENPLRVAYMAVVAQGHLLTDPTTAGYWHRYAGHPAYALHLNRLVELGGYTLDDHDRQLIEPVTYTPTPAVTIPDDWPEGAVAWYAGGTDTDADPARWVDTADEAQAIDDLADGRLHWRPQLDPAVAESLGLDDPTVPTEPENQAENTDDNDDTPAPTGPVTAPDDQPVAEWQGHPVVPGRTCPASRTLADIEDGADGPTGTCPACGLDAGLVKGGANAGTLRHHIVPTAVTS